MQIALSFFSYLLSKTWLSSTMMLWRNFWLYNFHCCLGCVFSLVAVQFSVKLNWFLLIVFAISFFFCLMLLDPLFNQIKSNSQALGNDVQFGALNKVWYMFSNSFSFLFFLFCKMIVSGNQIQCLLNVLWLVFLCVLGTVSQPLGTSDINISAFVGSQAFSFPKDSQTKLAIASVSGSHRENWGESNMADASPRTETSTDDTDDKNQEVISLDELA